ncbi:MAG TPA: radical SAM family heme chaperone HemW [Taishania sp.]|nr:radical SAM family heme chaperone HemW [Taishania sp.]
MAGIYIHIPFCKQKCTYCDFHFSTTFQSYRQRMIDAMCREIEMQRTYLSDSVIETIYFGGGTPSLLTNQELHQLLDKIHATFTVSSAPEITLEANPDDISDQQVKDWKAIGVNRLSIGLQSFKASDLAWMNRAHTVEESMVCLDIAIQNGIENITVDLMYGLPDLSNEKWKKHIEQVIQKGVNHISAYCLTVEEGTALDKFVETGKIVPASENTQAEQFLILLETVEKNGFHQYEISNFCKTGFESKHNSNYWKGVHYLGIGPSAHSFNGFSRSWNIRNNQQYMKLIESNDSWFDQETLSPNDQFNELILTGLRTIYGVNLDQLNTILPLPNEFKALIQEFIQLELMEQNESIIRLTKSGKLQADRIASDLFVV